MTETSSVEEKYSIQHQSESWFRYLIPRITKMYSLENTSNDFYFFWENAKDVFFVYLFTYVSHFMNPSNHK